MVRHLFPRFLDHAADYECAEQKWNDIWEGIDPFVRETCGWSCPWLTGEFVNGRRMADGNPIFSAWSPRRARGIRVIQHAPASEHVEFQWWLDSFGGDFRDPDSIEELVIACALSDEAAARAARLMSAWVRGGYPVVTFSNPFTVAAPFIDASTPAGHLDLIGV